MNFFQKLTGSEAEVASKSWDLHLQRNQSVIVDLFQGTITGFLSFLPFLILLPLLASFFLFLPLPASSFFSLLNRHLPLFF
jgi:hypothetical protein